MSRVSWPGCTECGQWSGHDPDCPQAPHDPDTEELEVIASEIGVVLDERSRVLMRELDEQC